jgi:hypothetical protein
LQGIAKPSVQSLLIRLCFGNTPISTATGFVCESAKGPVLITNWHNVAGRNPLTDRPLSPTLAIPDRVEILHNRADTLGAWVIKSESLFAADGRPRWIEHPQFGPQVDVVALPLTDLRDVALYPHDLTAGENLFVGPAELVSVVGFPLGLRAGGFFAVWVTGFMASEPDVDFDAKPLMLIDCRSLSGQSGSPVIMYRSGGMLKMRDGSVAAFMGPVSRFLGIYSGRVHKDSDIGRVWKHHVIADILRAV